MSNLKDILYPIDWKKIGSFKGNTDLGVIQDSIFNALPRKYDKQVTNEHVIRDIDHVLSLNPKLLENIESYGLIMAKELTKSFEHITKNVATTVSALTKKIEDMVKDNLKNNYQISITSEGLLPTTPEYIILDLERNYNTLRTILSRLTDTYKVDTSSNVLSTSVLVALNVKIPKLTEITVDSDYYDYLLESLTKDTTVDKEDIAFVLKSLITNNNELVDLTSYSNLTTKDQADNLYRLYNLLQKRPAFEHVSTVLNTLSISEDVKPLLLENLKILSNRYDLCCLLDAIVAESYKDKLIISENILNLQELDKFKAETGKLSDIANFIRVKYNHNKNDVLYHKVYHEHIPVTGISTEMVNKGIDYTNKYLTNAIEDTKDIYKQKKNNAYLDAFNIVLYDYGKQLVENNELPELYKNDTRAFYNFIGIKVHQTQNNFVSSRSVEDVLYDFYFNTIEPNSLAHTLYYKMNSKLLSSTEALELQDVDKFAYMKAATLSEVTIDYFKRYLEN